MTSRISAGVRTDFSNILNEFTKTESVRYEHFLEVWERMSVPDIYCGRTSHRELKEFTEECLRIAVSLWMPPQDFHQRVGALYLLYGLYNVQTVSQKCKIRVTISQWLEIKSFQDEVEQQQHYDACYILRWLKTHGAFEYVATPTTLYPGMPGYSAEDRDDSDLQSERNKGSSIVSMLVQSSVIDELSSIHDQYYTMKCALNDGKAPHSSLSVVHPNIVQTVTKCVTVYEEWRKTGKRERRKRKDSGMTSESDAESEQEVPSTRSQQGSVRSRIRDKAYSQKAVSTRSRRHRGTDESTSASQGEGSPDKRKTKRGRKSARKEAANSDIASPRRNSKKRKETSESDSTMPSPNTPLHQVGEAITEESAQPSEATDSAEPSGVSREAMKNILMDMPLLEKDEARKAKRRRPKTDAKSKETTSKRKDAGDAPSKQNKRSKMNNESLGNKGKAGPKCKAKNAKKSTGSRTSSRRARSQLGHNEQDSI